MKGKKIFVIFLLLLLIFPLSFYAHSHTDRHPLRLNNITDDALQLAKNEKYVEANNLLEIFFEEFSKVMLTERDIPMDQIQLITIVHNQSVEAITDDALPHEGKVRAMTRFRLVVDAFTSEHQPIWTEMEVPLLTTFHQLKDTIEMRDSDSYHNSYHRLLLHYDLIHPSLRMDVKPETIRKVDAHIEYLSENQNELLSMQSMDQLAVMEADFKSLFENLKEDEADPSLIWVMISTGSIIFFTLSYVGWRKYEADRKIAMRKKGKE
ncbi:sporulation protein YpjB [Sutcliffiella deserti]|uniref:sporulation protein YpjB n=1 Tax=Sutcliffiella deserti TaxID=2875501 RepID=UPI001CC0CC6D|nr:sporulation protein YpjB [Sutcliffiella deserti]